MRRIFGQALSVSAVATTTNLLTSSAHLLNSGGSSCSVQPQQIQQFRFVKLSQAEWDRVDAHHEADNGGYFGGDNDDNNATIVRDCSPISVLKVIRQDPGMSAMYYAKKYFGGEHMVTHLNHVLWSDLKRYGKIEVKNSSTTTPASSSSTTSATDASSSSSEPIWFPLRAFRGTRHRVTQHRAEDEDLSLLEGYVPQIPDFLKGDQLPQPPKIPSISSASPSDSSSSHQFHQEVTKGLSEF